MIASSLIGISLALNSDWWFGWVLLVLGSLIAVMGLWDDIQHLSARVRFGVQTLVYCGLLVALGDLPAVNFTPFLPEDLALKGWVLLILLLVAGLWWINLFNFMDGIDGLAGSQAVFMLVASVGLAIWQRPDTIAEQTWLWTVCIAAATVGFLLLNWPPARIFMGDVGSTYLGFMIFALALLSVKTADLSYQMWLILSAVFVTDATVTLASRLLRGERLYQAHRSHAYQHLAQRWRSHCSVTLAFLGINVTFLLPLAWCCFVWPQWAWVYTFVAYAPLTFAAMMLKAGRQDERNTAIRNIE